VLILALLIGLTAALIYLCGSSARSYFDKGRLRGNEEAAREIIRGLELHYTQQNSKAIPKDVLEAIDALQNIGRKSNRRAPPQQAPLWLFGDAAGRACWHKGYVAGLQELAPDDDKIRLDFSAAELMQLGSLAHLGFQHTMPNYRDLEVHRFTGEENAIEGNRIIERLEKAVLARQQVSAAILARSPGRQHLIRDWWRQQAPERLMA
jgi:hypothetical protein